MAPETSLGGQIRRARGRLGARLGRRVTQADLARMIGRSRSAINSWEKDRTIPGEGDLAALEEALGTSLPGISPPSVDPALQRMIDQLTEDERELLIARLRGEPDPPPRQDRGQGEGRHRRENAGLAG